MSVRRTLSEALAVRVGLSPRSMTTTQSTTFFNMADPRKAWILINVGATTAVLTATVKKASDSSGTGAANLATTRVVTFSATDDNKVALIEIDSGELSSDKPYIGVALVSTGDTAVLVSVQIILADLHEAPASNLPADGVVSITY